MKKRPFPICTVNYYDLATGFFSLFEWREARIVRAAKELQVFRRTIILPDRSKADAVTRAYSSRICTDGKFQEHEKQTRILNEYATKKAAFCKEYELDSESKEYDRCYDIFGTLGYPEHLKRIQEEYQARLNYE